MTNTQYYAPLTLEITPDDEGKMVRTVLERRLGVSRKLMSRLKLTDEGIMLNGRRVYTSERVHAGDVLALRMEQEQSDDILPQPMYLDIIYEDDYLLIINKPAGIIVHPTHGHYTGTLANGVVHHWMERGEKIRFRPIHRLDQETSGVVAIAKNPYVHQQLSEQMQRGEIEKEYCAFVYGAPEQRDGTVDAPIDRDPDMPHVRIVTADGYPSITHYQTVHVFGDRGASLVRLQLETGRTHQIRVHMKHIGCPLIGDKMYGNPKFAELGWAEQAEAAAGRQALHAQRLAFVHPYTKQNISFKAELPEDLLELERLLSTLK
ncbi:RluA family pseudouridine synthase [Paenibacillus abyssi]|uniref:Pseudouridine synthase n=1 Tax=Paenibacillus abyssi TaxID=1340531 RepID=A0A917FT11_9BACL|nr:RluA family pseudouridine synthase [Paenibacillus abyssi]GGF99332.1 RNA pseudouridine synthase [Paenibacillus abyssi]